MQFKPCPKTGFLIGSSRPSEQHAVDTVRVDLFVIYRRLLCDFCRRCRGMASMAVRCVGHRLSSHYQSNSSSNLSRCDMSLTFHFFSVFFQCLSVSNFGMQTVVLTWKFVFFPYRIEHYPTSINTRIKLRFRNFQKKNVGCASRPHPVCTSGCCGAKQVT